MPPIAATSLTLTARAFQPRSLQAHIRSGKVDAGDERIGGRDLSSAGALPDSGVVADADQQAGVAGQGRGRLLLRPQLLLDALDKLELTQL